MKEDNLPSVEVLAHLLSSRSPYVRAKLAHTLAQSLYDEVLRIERVKDTPTDIDEMRVLQDAAKATWRLARWFD